MVTETGEATARFLKSIARGEIDPNESINEQARAGLKRVSSIRTEDRPGDCRLASRQLVRPNAYGMFYLMHMMAWHWYARKLCFSIRVACLDAQALVAYLLLASWQCKCILSGTTHGGH
jgi:hypothetical protein